MTTKNMEARRKAFEAWYLKDSGYDKSSLDLNHKGEYISDDAHSCWEGWNAA